MTRNQAQQALKNAYLVDFSADLFSFWEFTKEFGNSNPLQTFSDTLGIRLEGPFKVLAGKADAPLNGWHLGSRYYDDPPEFFIVFSGDTDGLHWGCWFDDPDSEPSCCLADYDSRNASDLTEDGETLFEAFRLQLEGCQMTTLEYIETDMDIEQARPSYEARLESYAMYRSRLVCHATGERAEVGAEYLEKYAGTSSRNVVADMFDGMGIVVPEAFYRPLSLDDRELRAKAVAEADLSEVVAEAQRALAEGFPGTALKLGRDLWVGNEWQKQDSYRLLNSAYKALNRPTSQMLLSRIVSVRKK